MITFTGAGKSLTLPSPQLKDREILRLRFVYKRMMNGDIRSYRMGPVITTLTLDFQNLNRPKVLETINFARHTAGQKLEYIDYRGEKWFCRIMNEPYDFTHVDIRNNTFTLTLETYNV